MADYVINSDESLRKCIQLVHADYIKHRYLRIKVKTGKDRNLDQNALSHIWYSQIAKELPEDNELGWRCYCKLTIGVPILRAESEEFRKFYDGALKKLDYEQKLEAMKFVPITSIMTVPQMSAYMEQMQLVFAKRGVILESVNG